MRRPSFFASLTNSVSFDRAAAHRRTWRAPAGARRARWRTATGSSGPTPAARPRRRSVRRSSRSSSSLRRNSYSCSWKSSTATPLVRGGTCRCVRSAQSHSAIGSPHGLAVEIAGRLAARRRSTCTRPTRTASSPPRALARHYGRAGYDVVALTDHWHRSDAPSSPDLVVLPGVELNCLLPSERDGHVLGIGIERDPAELAGERRDLAATGDWIVGAGGVAYLAHPYWTGARAGALELPPTVDGDRGLQRRLRARGRAGALVGALGRAPRGRAASARRSSTDDSHHPGFDSDHAWTWIRRRARPREHPRRAAHGPLLREHRTAAPRRRDDRRGTSSCGARPPGRSRSLPGKTSGAAVNAGRLGYRYGARGPRGLRRRLDRRGTARPARPTAPFARLEVVDPAGQPRVDEPAVAVLAAVERRAAARESLARRVVRPARRRRRRDRRGDRRARGPRGSRRRPRRRRATSGRERRARRRSSIHGGLRYLRLGDVRLVREAHHERRTLADDRRAAPRPPPPVPPAALPGRAVPSGVRAERDPPLLDARAVPPQLARPAGSRARSSCRSSVSTGCARARSMPTPGRTTRGSASRTSSPRQQAGATVAEPRRGRRAPARRRARSRGAEVVVDGEVVDVAGARHGERRRAVGGRRPSARGSARRHVGAAQQGRARARPGRERLDRGAHDPAGRRPGHVRGPVVRDAPARDDGHRLRRRPGDVAVEPADVERDPRGSREGAAVRRSSSAGSVRASYRGAPRACRSATAGGRAHGARPCSPSAAAGC